MKIRFLLMALFAIFARLELSAQANCANPPNCIVNWGTNPMGPLGAQTTNLPDWFTFMGTPIYGPGMNNSTGIQMVSDAGTGEGMYACFNFLPNTTYFVCLMATNTNNVQGGSFILEAFDPTNGTQTIYNQPYFNNGGYAQLNVKFTTGNSSYTQFRMHTNATSGSNYSVVVDDIGIVEVPVLSASPSTIDGCGVSRLTAANQTGLNITWSPNTNLNTIYGGTVFANPCQTTTYTATYFNPNCFSGYCTKEEQVTVTVNPGVSTTANPPNIDGCGSSRLIASSTNPMDVTWTPNTGLDRTRGNMVTARPCSTTTYTATFTCANGCSYTSQVTVYVSPGVSVTASPATIDVCGNSTLTASSTNPMSVTWAPSTGLSSTYGNVVTAHPCSTTTYTATYLCSTGCTYTKNITVYVNQNSGTTVTASPPTIDVCGSSILNASSTNPMSVTWSPSAGLSSPYGNIVSASPCDTTIYTAAFYCPLNSCTYTKDVQLNVTPNGRIADSTDAPCFSAINLEYVPSTPCAGSTYEWYGPHNNLLSTTSKLFKNPSTPSDQGLYMLIVRTPQGCVDTFYSSVVMDCCDLTADFKIIDCNPIRFENMTLDANGNIIILGEWYWDFGDGASSTLRNPSHLYRNQQGPMEICLTAVISDSFSTCCAKICKDTFVCDFVCDPKAAFDYNIVTPGGSDVQFTDKSVGGTTAIGWEWYVNGVLVSTLQNPLLTLGPPLPPGPPLPQGATHEICLKVEFSQPFGPSCFEQWCEYIQVP